MSVSWRKSRAQWLSGAPDWLRPALIQSPILQPADDNDWQAFINAWDGRYQGIKYILEATDPPEPIGLQARAALLMLVPHLDHFPFALVTRQLPEIWLSEWPAYTYLDRTAHWIRDLPPPVVELIARLLPDIHEHLAATTAYPQEHLQRMRQGFQERCLEVLACLPVGELSQRVFVLYDLGGESLDGFTKLLAHKHAPIYWKRRANRVIRSRILADPRLLPVYAQAVYEGILPEYYFARSYGAGLLATQVRFLMGQSFPIELNDTIVLDRRLWPRYPELRHQLARYVLLGPGVVTTRQEIWRNLAAEHHLDTWLERYRDDAKLSQAIRRSLAALGVITRRYYRRQKLSRPIRYLKNQYRRLRGDWNEY